MNAQAYIQGNTVVTPSPFLISLSPSVYMVYFYYPVIDTLSHCKRFELGDYLFVCHAGMLAGLRYDIVLKFHCSNCVLGGKSIQLLVHVVCVSRSYLNMVTGCNGILPANGALA